MMGEWDDVENKLYGTGIKYRRVDTTDPKYKKLKDNFNVKKIPYIVKIDTDGMRYVFDGKRKCDDIIAWLYF